MKRLVLLFAGLLIGLATASAAELNSQKQNKTLDKTKNYRYVQPIIFMERGIEFLIFPDGSFDFNTNTSTALSKGSEFNNNLYYKNNSKRGSINTNIKYSNSSINRGVPIIRDRNGKIRRIGNVFLNYDRYGNITRAGSVFIQYNKGRNSIVNQIGGLRVKYNHWGEIVNTRGYINRYNRNNNYIIKQHEGIVYNNDTNYYYYKQNGKFKKQKMNKK